MKFTAEEITIIERVVKKCDEKYAEAFSLTYPDIDDLHCVLENARTVHGNLARDLEHRSQACLVESNRVTIKPRDPAVIRGQMTEEEKYIAFLKENGEEISEDIIRMIQNISKIKGITNYPGVHTAVDDLIGKLQVILHKIVKL